MKTFEEWWNELTEGGLMDYLDFVELQIYKAGAKKMYQYIFDEMLEEVPYVEAATGEYLDRWTDLPGTRESYIEGEPF